ncbi:hypothetical protein [Citrifermentans bremense]|uniref:hypothetical protein n=1 Tax=Citrifermentans bremense TaxID=60035 RepID=UPI0012EBAF20|nr:hypothetical protein [Citrifermentans bremense]
MTEDGKQGQHKGWLSLVSSLLSWVPAELREMVGMFIGICLFVSVPMIFIAGGKLIKKLIEKPAAADNSCWKLQSLQ